MEIPRHKAPISTRCLGSLPIEKPSLTSELHFLREAENGKVDGLSPTGRKPKPGHPSPDSPPPPAKKPREHPGRRKSRRRARPWSNRRSSARMPRPGESAKSGRVVSGSLGSSKASQQPAGLALECGNVWYFATRCLYESSWVSEFLGGHHAGGHVGPVTSLEGSILSWSSKDLDRPFRMYVIC